MMPTSTLVLPRPFLPAPRPTVASPTPSRRPRTPRGLASLLVALPIGLLIGVSTAGRTPAAVSVSGPTRRAPSQPAAPDSLRILSYNIWGLPAVVNGASSERFKAIGREVSRLSPDVVLLQEVWTSAAHEARPPGQWWSARADEGSILFDSSNGLLTLSRFPIIRSAFHAFSHTALPDSLVSKGALEATLRLPDGRRLTVWNVHLQSRDAAADVRSSQIAELRQWVGATDEGQVADVVGGDFNSPIDSGNYRELSALGEDVQGPARGLRLHFPTYDALSANPLERQTLDYVFLRDRGARALLPGAVQRVLDAARLADRLSDHLGLLVVLRLRSS